MQLALSESTPPFKAKVVKPTRELAAYEALWTQEGATHKRIADLFKANPGALPSELVDRKSMYDAMVALDKLFTERKISPFDIRVRGANEYPERLRDAKNPLEVLYYQGQWNLMDFPSVAIVGARKASEEGIRRARKLVHHFVHDGVVIMSGLAQGIDRAAHLAALEFGGRTIGVIGTPLTHYYPSENKDLQDTIRRDHLLISQVPFLRYTQQDYRANRSFFPERNITMSALSQATIIVEASDTSGTLYQARAAIAQKRKLFILDSCFERKGLEWPHKFEKKGAIRVTGYEDIAKAMKDV